LGRQFLLGNIYYLNKKTPKKSGKKLDRKRKMQYYIKKIDSFLRCEGILQFIDWCTHLQRLEIFQGKREIRQLGCRRRR
jgi:hypothetical protein